MEKQITGAELFERFKALPVVDRIAFAALLIAKPSGSTLSTLCHLTQADYHALGTPDWIALQDEKAKVGDLEYHLESVGRLVDHLKPLLRSRLGRNIDFCPAHQS